MVYIGIVLLMCLARVPGSFSHDDIHNFMSHEEVQQVFHTDHDSVPKYEIARVHLSERLHKRDLPAGSKMHIKAFGENINLWLHPGNAMLAGEDMPVYYGRYSADKIEGVEFSRRDGLMTMVGRIFEDPNKLASLVIGTEVSGRLRVNGNIESNGIAIRSLPPRVAEEYRRRRRSVGDSDDLDSPYHLVFKTNDSYEETFPALALDQAALRQTVSQHGSGIPDTLYPEILVIVEYSLYSSYGRDIYGLLQYLLAFWNGVDLKYRSLESPSVRFHISGIVLAEDPRATPYISNNSLSDNVFNSSAALTNAGEFFYAVRDTFLLDEYDISVTMTKQVFGIDSDARVLGVAWVGNACKKFDGYWSTENVALVRDNGAFSGVHTAAHELGHQLGANHDLIGGDCVTQTGFIMAFTPKFTTNSSDFSPCSTETIDTLLKASKLDCLFNRPEPSLKKLPKLMPGRMMNLDAQCKALDKKGSCQQAEHSDFCSNISCLESNDECRQTKTGALDGTSCGDNKFCLHMQCVSL